MEHLQLFSPNYPYKKMDYTGLKMLPRANGDLCHVNGSLNLARLDGICNSLLHGKPQFLRTTLSQIITRDK
jgi:hypothetical protein